MIWNKVKTLRKKRNLTQPQVAVGAGIGVTTLWMIESGYDAKISPEIKKKIADYFNCEVSDIFPAEMYGNMTREEFIKKHGRK
jgi:DNA-binding XRE family transcriptional regulator